MILTRNRLYLLFLSLKLFVSFSMLTFPENQNHSQILKVECDGYKIIFFEIYFFFCN